MRYDGVVDRDSLTGKTGGPGSGMSESVGRHGASCRDGERPPRELRDGLPLDPPDAVFRCRIFDVED